MQILKKKGQRPCWPVASGKPAAPPKKVSANSKTLHAVFTSSEQSPLAMFLFCGTKSSARFLAPPLPHETRFAWGSTTELRTTRKDAILAPSPHETRFAWVGTAELRTAREGKRRIGSPHGIAKMARRKTKAPLYHFFTSDVHEMLRQPAHVLIFAKAHCQLAPCVDDLLRL